MKFPVIDYIDLFTKTKRQLRSAILIILSFVALFTTYECESETEPLPPEPEPAPAPGHLKISVTYPEPIIINGSLEGFQQVPGEEAAVILYQNKDARCLGYKDAAVGFAMDGDTVVLPKYRMWTNGDGEVFIENVEAGEYYLTIFTIQVHKYTEKYIEIPVGDTLELKKDFTPDVKFYEDLEPWDYEIPAD